VAVAVFPTAFAPSMATAPTPAKIEPVPPDDANAASVWDRRAAYIKKHGRLTEDFTPPARGKQTWGNPLDE
jgi:hypothetical protein